MALIEVLGGDFARGGVRIRYSDAGRAYLGLTSKDGRREDVFLASDISAAARAGEGRIDDLLSKLAERDGFALTLPPDDCAPTHRRGDLVFVVLLRDGRKCVARGTFEAFTLIRSAALPPERRREELARLEAVRLTPPAGFLPHLFARFLPQR